MTGKGSRVSAVAEGVAGLAMSKWIAELMTWERGLQS